MINKLIRKNFKSLVLIDEKNVEIYRIFNLAKNEILLFLTSYSRFF